MSPADKARTSAWSPRPTYESTHSSSPQESANGRESVLSQAILLVNFEPAHRDALQRDRRRLYFVAADSKSLQNLHDDELRQADVVFFDVTNIRNDLWSPLRRVCRLRKHDGSPLLVHCWSREYHPWVLHRMVEAVGAGITYSPEWRSVSHAIDLMRAERAALSMRGPHFIITHRFWQPNTICTPGEMISKIELAYGRKRFSVPLSTSGMLDFDYLARHRMGQSASQIAAGFSVDPFSQEHGAHVNARELLVKQLSRNAVKQRLARLRAALRAVFRKAGLNADPSRVLIAEGTEGNEVRYRLKISVEWKHVRF